MVLLLLLVLMDCLHVLVVVMLLLAGGRNSNDTLVTDGNIHSACLRHLLLLMLSRRVVLGWHCLEAQLERLLMLLLLWHRRNGLATSSMRAGRLCGLSPNVSLSTHCLHNVHSARPKCLWTQHDPIVVHLGHWLRRRDLWRLVLQLLLVMMMLLLLLHGTL